jgi:lambda family phage portal protein
MKINFFTRNKNSQNRNETAAPKRAVYMAVRQYAAAKTDRLTAGFLGVTASADAMVRGSLTRARARSRQLAADNDYARRFFKLARVNVVGSQGIRLQVRSIERETADGIIYDDRANTMIETGWLEWSRKKYCCMDGRLSLIDVMQLIVETVAKDGEIFIRKIKGRAANNSFGFALQLIEADHIDEALIGNLPNGNRIRMGIEYDEWNRPVAYHVNNRHPGDSYTSIGDDRNQIQRIPAADMIHLYAMERPSQSRGMPWLITAMRRLNMLGGYEEAELVAAREASAKMGFYKLTEGAELNQFAQDENGYLIREVEAGQNEVLPQGVEFQQYDPQHPTAAFGEFVTAVLRGAASGLGVSYNSLANDLKGVNFSSIRQGVLEERELWKMLQTWIIEHFCADIFEEWLLMSLTTQKIPLPLNKFDKFNAPVWRPRGWQWVDPLKDVKASIEGINAGLYTAQDVAAQQGNDIEDVYAQLAAEKRLREKYGIQLANPDVVGMEQLLIEGDSDAGSTGN